MEQLAIGKRNYVIGMRWQEGDLDRKPLAQIKDATGTAKALYCAHDTVDGRVSLGYVLTAGSKAKGRLYSLAEACATLGLDGIFALPYKGGIWYAVIASGQVVPETDVCITFDAGLTALEGMQSSFGFTIYYGGEEPLPLHGCESFSTASLAGAKIKPLKSVGGASSGAAIALVMLLAGGGYLAWDTFAPAPAPEGTMTPEQLAQQREAYLGGMRSQLAELPASADWASEAFAGARAAFPVAISGWRLEGFACNPKQCVGTYLGSVTRQISPVIAAFGAQRVALTDSGHGMTVTLPLNVKGQAWSDQQILAPAAWPRPLVDVLGRAHGAFMVHVDGEAAITDIAAALAPPADARPVMKEVVAFKVDGHLSRTQLTTLAYALAQEGFVATTIAVAESAKAGSSSWRVEFSRVGGQA